MKKIIAFVCATIMVCTLSSCTEQERIREFGGEMTITLEPGEKLMMVTWKDNHLFYLTEPMEPGYQPKKKTFRENSSWGMLESTVYFVERR